MRIHSVNVLTFVFTRRLFTCHVACELFICWNLDITQKCQGATFEMSVGLFFFFMGSRLS